MEKFYIDKEYFLFGGKGDFWACHAHIASVKESVTLCGKPMLSTNWVRIQEVDTPGCEECIEIYNQRKNDNKIS